MLPIVASPLLVCIWLLQRQILALQRELRDTTREYKTCQAAKEGDYGTVRTLRPLSKKALAGVKQKSEEAEPEIEYSGLTFTQHG